MNNLKGWRATILMLIAIPFLLTAGNFSLNRGEVSKYTGDKTFYSNIGAPGSGDGTVVTIETDGTDNYATSKLILDASVGAANAGGFIVFQNDGTTEGEIMMYTDGRMGFINYNSSSNIGFAIEKCGGIAMLSKTEAELKAIAPTKAGLQFYDSTNKAIVLSTGTGVGAFGLITDGSTSPTGW